MKARTARLLASWVLVAAAVVSPVFAHTGGSNGYASVAIDRDSVRYSLTLWPAALPPAIGDELRRARIQSRFRVSAPNGFGAASRKTRAGISTSRARWAT